MRKPEWPSQATSSISTSRKVTDSVRGANEPGGPALSSSDTVLWEQSGPVGRITLNRPETLNAWIAEFGAALRDILTGPAADPSVRAVMITGAGRGFSSGADLKAGFDPHPGDGMPDVKKELHDVYHPAIAALRRIPKPVVACVNGPAVGIGCSLALACDLVLAAESAFFGLAFVTIGLMPDGGSTLFVPAAVGKARAFQMALLGERIPARQAHEWGLVNFVHPDEHIGAEADVLIEKLANGPTRSYAGTKEALNQMLYPNMDDQLALEARLQHQLARSKDFIEGVGAFVEKRAAAFTGT